MAKSKVTDAEIIETVIERFENTIHTASEAQVKKVIRKLKSTADVTIKTEFRTRKDIVDEVVDVVCNLMGDQVVAVAKTIGINDKDIIKELEHKANIEARRGELRETLNARVSEAYAAIADAQKIADDIGVPFNFDLAYGMGGTYIPKGERNPDHFKEGMWMSSSMSC